MPRRLRKRSRTTPAPMSPKNTPAFSRRVRRCNAFPMRASNRVSRSSANANRWWRLAAGKYHRSKVPAPGTVMVFNGSHEDPRGHVAVVRLVKDSRTLIVDHANWYGHGEITISNPVTDISPNNDWSQVKVWWIPGDQWGARTFSIAGFIYPEHEVASAGGVHRDRSASGRRRGAA